MSYTPLTELDEFTSVLYQQQSPYAALAPSAISRGATRLQSGDFAGAVAEFRRAAAYDPSSTTALRYLGKTYLMMGRQDDAIAAFQKALKLDTTDDTVRGELAGAYVKAQRYTEAEKEYVQLARKNVLDAGARASLGYIYMETGRLEEAEVQFQRAARLSRNDAAAQYSLGLVKNRQGEYAEAVGYFERAIELRRDYAMAFADLGYAYLGLEDTDAAEAQVTRLQDLGTSEGATLAYELTLAMRTPRIAYAEISEGSFNPILGAGTPLYMLDASLATPGATKDFTMVFQFNQAMDLTSVQNRFNWSILKAAGGDAGVYNSGVTLTPEQQVYLLPIPISVSYDPATYKATVTFRVSQNATGNGIIDPEHWVFQFRGMDALGNPIDPRGDQYDGYARAPF